MKHIIPYNIFDHNIIFESNSDVLNNPFIEGPPSKEKAKEMNNWIKRNTNKYDQKYVKFYHSTDKSLDIEKTGLLPTSENRRRSFQSTSGFVYLSNTPERAEVFGKLGNPHGTKIYEVIVPIYKIKADLDQLNNLRSVGVNVGNTIGESIVYGGGIRVKGKIEPWQIKDVTSKYSNILESNNILLSPNGKPSNLNQKQWLQVRTSEFKEWFGDWENDPKNASKVVDDNGEPLVVYHRTYGDFSEFDNKKGIYKKGFVGGDLFYFSDDRYAYSEYGNRELECFINLRNPTSEVNINGEYIPKSNDGAILKYDRFGAKETVVVATKSNQIKSATENIGNFDKNNNNINETHKTI